MIKDVVYQDSLKNDAKLNSSHWICFEVSLVLWQNQCQNNARSEFLFIGESK